TTYLRMQSRLRMLGYEAWTAAAFVLGRSTARGWANHPSIVTQMQTTGKCVNGARDQFFSRYPVLKIHHTAARQAPRKTAVAARLTPTFTSATSKKLQRKP